jgi:tol-pal system protein YbgF
MKIQRVLVIMMALLLATPAFAASKEIVQLQTMVQQLQNQMSLMQQSFDERMGMMKNLIEQSTDNMNKVAASITTLQQALAKQQTDAGQHSEQLSGQIQALNDSLDEMKARIVKLSKQLDDMQAAQQNLANPAAAQPGAAPPPPAPPPEVLYPNALRDYNAGKYDLAAQEFSDYLKFYPTADLAGNAQFYLAEIEYRSGNFEQAVKDYDKVLEQYPGGNKAKAAQLKKGMALVELGQRDAGAKELRSLIQRYPQSVEADQARQQLAKLRAPARPAPRRPSR